VRAGVRGFVDQHSAGTDLARAVVAMAQSEVFMSPTLAGRLLDWTASRLPRRLAKLTRLSLREREVLSLLGRGESNLDIARRLRIREATVRSHVYHILTKLDLKSRTEAALLGYQHGFSDADEPALHRTIAPAMR
jgi:DNA-binding NarL/FixJ family response regulator